MGYLLQYRDGTSNGDITNVTVESELKQYEITGLKKFTKYFLRLAAFNSVGVGHFNDWIDWTCVTLEDGKFCLFLDFSFSF